MMHPGIQHEAQKTHLFCLGFYPWKRAYVRRYLAAYRVSFADTAWGARLRGLDASSVLVAWGQRAQGATQALSRRFGVPVWRMEDGFLRSVGLGSDRYEPGSLVLDRTGIYYDPRAPSDLECILEQTRFEPEELERAAALRARIVDAQVSKYNVGDRMAKLPSVPAGQRVVLVPGQVEDDASIQLGCVDIRTNLGLLEAAREARPDAFLIFKPHPDVVAGNRRGHVPEEAARRLADAVVLDAPLPACLALADEVHTLTSLVGFEALLRGREVRVFGQPFYAGWGLTIDRHPVTRRTRRLTLDELVAGTLIRYPLYLDPATGTLTSPERMVDLLQTSMARADGAALRVSWLRRQARKAQNALRGVFHGL